MGLSTGILEPQYRSYTRYSADIPMNYGHSDSGGPKKMHTADTTLIRTILERYIHIYIYDSMSMLPTSSTQGLIIRTYKTY